MKSHKAVVVTPQPEASEAGVEILRAGGNAIDAAIACAFVQGVVDPLMCGIAGFGSLGFYEQQSKSTSYIDFHSPAPQAVKPDMWEKLILSEARDGFGFILEGAVNEMGYQSMGVPGSLKAYQEAHQKHGKLPWHVLLEPAIEWAKNGWKVRQHVEEFWSDEGQMGRRSVRDRIAYSPSGKAMYCREDGSPKRVGDLVINSDYANTLTEIAIKGADTFYFGEIAEQIVGDMKRNGGLISMQDLNSFNVKYRAPLRGRYKEFDIATNNPPGGGLLLLQMLKMLEHVNLLSLGHNTAEYMRVVSEVMRRATVNKDRFIGDPAFVDIPIEKLLSESYIQQMVEEIKAGVRQTVPRFNSGHPSKDTTHISIADKEGNCVSMTHSLGMPSGVITDGLGFMYNGCMAVFDPRPGHAGSLAPGKSRFTSLCPSFLFKNNEPYLVIGAPGATQIAMGVLQVILNHIEFDMNMTESVSAPRFSGTSDALDVSNRIPRYETRELEKQGYEVIRNPFTYGFASVHAISFANGKTDGAADPGHDGTALYC
ncbi:MAG: gamma-glutamyltransferase [Pelistega sp.]|nr:gamma-glutamyltransferase [Pelistega sp.]